MKKYPEIKAIFKYLIVGLINTSVNYLVYNLLLYKIKIHIYLAASIGFFVGASISYHLNSKYTFKSKNISKKQFLKFILLQILIMVFFGLLVYLLYNFVYLNKNYAWFFSTLIATLINFKSQKKLFSSLH